MSARKDMQAFLKRVQEAGCIIEQNRKSHYRVTLPNGRKISVANSPKSGNAVRAAEREFRRNGLVV